MTRHLLIALGFAASVAAAADPAAGVANSIVEVVVTAQRYDPQIPWRQERPVGRLGYGVAIAPGRIVTCEDLVRNATLVEVRRPGKADKIQARLIQSDARANAALLDVPSRAGTNAFPALEWNEAVATGTQVTLAQFDAAGQMQTGDGRITEIAVEPLPGAPHNLLTFSVLTDLKFDRSGAPVLRDGRLVGLVMHYDDASQTSLVLPAPVLKAFVSSADRPPYTGLATAGVMWSPLIDPVKRRYYGLPEDDRGVLVSRTVPGTSAASALAPDDVILQWDGRAVDSQGYYDDPDFGRLSFSHLIAGRRRPGDTVPVTIWRDRQSVDVAVRLDPFSDETSLIPLNTEGRQASYLVEGGILLRELTADYLFAHGNRWMLNANPRLVNLYLTRAHFPSSPGEKVVILAAILPDLINRGYQGYRDDIVTHVNGERIANLKDVFAIRERDGGIWRIATQSRGVDIVLNADELEAANRRIAERYRIPQLRLMR